jgi:hypothetical protein
MPGGVPDRIGPKAVFQQRRTAALVSMQSFDPD